MTSVVFQQAVPLRLDRFLQSQWSSLSFSFLNRALRENKIKVNGKKVPLSTRLQPGDEVKLFLTDDQLMSGSFAKATANVHVLYDDDHFLIVDKPAGTVTLSEDEQNVSMLSLCRAYLKENARAQKPVEPIPCHRLDTGTSGVLIFAKSNKDEQFIRNLIQSHQLTKTYLCVTFGHPVPDKGCLNDYLLKDSLTGTVRILHEPAKNAKAISTQYRTLATSGALALLEITLITGRTHQIRAHMASIQTPIIGDSKYGNNEINRKLKLKYQALCAYRIRFPVLEGEYAYLSNRSFSIEKPWYVKQVLDHSLVV